VKRGLFARDRVDERARLGAYAVIAERREDERAGVVGRGFESRPRRFADGAFDAIGVFRVRLKPVDRGVPRLVRLLRVGASSPPAAETGRPTTPARSSSRRSAITA
jgi:hypothetical protein